jgi:segregation and condensation protein B
LKNRRDGLPSWYEFRGMNSAPNQSSPAIGAEIANRAYEIVCIGDGWRVQTREQFAPAVRAALPHRNCSPLTKLQSLILTAIAYFQPLTRRDLSQVLSGEIGRDLLSTLRGSGLIGAGPRSASAPSARSGKH